MDFTVQFQQQALLIFSSSSSGYNGLHGTWWHHTPGNRFKDLFNLGRTARERVVPEPIPVVILDQFDKSDQQSPWMWPMKNQSFEEDSGYLFFDRDTLRFTEEIEHDAGKVMGMAGWIAKLVCNSVQAHIAALVIKIHELLKDLHFWCMRQRILGALTCKGVNANIKNKGINFGSINLIGTFFLQK